MFGNSTRIKFSNYSPGGGGGRGGGILPSKRLIGMCRWMESHFHNWIN